MQDPLDEVARRVAKRYRLICFDEFHVSDVADAMILHRLLLKLFEHGTSFVMTSNYEPSTLYPEGLHRDRVLPAIELIQARMDVMSVDAGVDYRRRSLEQVQCYHTPLDERAQRRCKKRSISWPTRRRRNRCCISSTVRSARSGWPARWCGSTSPRCAAAPLAERLPGAGQPLPRRDPVRRAAHGAAPGLRGAPLHLADRRVLRPSRQAHHVGRVRAGRDLHRGRWPTSSTAPCRASWRCSRASTWNPNAGSP